MKKLSYAKRLVIGLILLTAFFACKKELLLLHEFNVKQTNLVADTAGFNAVRIDSNLINAWGIAAPPNNGPIWISANHSGLSVVYDRNGNQLRAPVTIPSLTAGQPGAPSGVLFNGTTEFGGNKFIFASEEGIIAAWSSGNAATKVADRSSSNAVYKGIAMATDGLACFLYVTNFRGGKIDVFDQNFNYVTDKPFNDPNIPTGFAPFNIQNIGGSLYVTYAKLKAPDDMDDQAGPGNGYVDIFTPKGVLVKRFASQGTLNSPWGIALAPAGFADDGPSILIGNFGDGRINVFNMGGHFKGQLLHGSQPITIDGLWAIDFLNSNATDSDPLYFTAGPNEESHGLFGYLKK